MSFRRSVFVLSMLVGTVLWNHRLWGQAVSGRILGTVTDPSGAALPNAKVRATNDATNVQTSALTVRRGTIPSCS
jgi:hypothetical protein